MTSTTGSTATTSFGLDITGSNITIADLSITGAYDGVVVEGGATNVTITDSTIFGNGFDNVAVPNAQNVTGLLIQNTALNQYAGAIGGTVLGIESALSSKGIASILHPLHG